MKKYEKPVVMVNEGLAEGVYAASGCGNWNFQGKWGGFADGWYKMTVMLQHNVGEDHSNEQVTVVITFSNVVTNAKKVFNGVEADLVPNGNVVTISNTFDGADMQAYACPSFEIWACADSEEATRQLQIETVEVK